MALTTKDKLLQIRIEQDLLDRLSRICDESGQTVSSAVRFFIRERVVAYEKRAASSAQWGATLAARAAAAQAAENQNKSPGEAVALSESPLVRKRRLEKEAKVAKMKKRAEAR